MPPLTVTNLTSALAGTRTVYATSEEPLKIPLLRGVLVSTRIVAPDTLSRISIRSSASFAASSDTALAVFSATTSTWLPSDGVTWMRPLTF